MCDKKHYLSRDNSCKSLELSHLLLEAVLPNTELEAKLIKTNSAFDSLYHWQRRHAAGSSGLRVTLPLFPSLNVFCGS